MTFSAPGQLGSYLDDLSTKYYGNDINRKPISYLAEYERFLAPIRHEPIKLLELGVRSGASMQMWRDYLPLATIVGIDIDEKPAEFPNDTRIHFLRGSQDNIDVLSQAMTLASGPFDVIIDDCSHIGHVSARSFAYLFPKALRSGGMYIIEDICTAFLAEHFRDAEPYCQRTLIVHGTPTRFPSHQNGMVGVVKQLFDHVMAPTANGGTTPYPIERMLILSNIVLLQKSSIATNGDSESTAIQNRDTKSYIRLANRLVGTRFLPFRLRRRLIGALKKAQS